MNNNASKWKVTPRDAALTLLSLGAASALCAFLRGLGSGDSYVPLLFVLSVLMVSRLTEGYACGIFAAVISVLGVNYIFTYPYMAFNFTISGYPVTFVAMLAVSISTSTLTTHIKNQEREKLEIEREKLRANLLRSVSHDLRTPLTTISGAVSVVLDNPELPQEEKKELLTGVKDDADWLLRMVENLLSVTRIGGSGDITKTPEAAEELAAEAAAKLRKRHPEVEISVSVPDEVIFVPVDAMLIEQVLVNLIENAALHGGSTSKVTVAVRLVGQTAVFSVVDNGEGISREAASRLFTDYFELAGRDAQSGEKRNMGIGLSVCRSIIKAHGGELRGENLPSGGACFSFSLPLK